FPPGMANRTTVTTFILVGFTGCHGCQPSIFTSFLFLYIFTVLENLVIVALVLQDSRLHKPMYIFLVNLSILDICYVSITLPNMLVNTLTGNHEIAFTACAVQLYVFNVLSIGECYLLAVMAYDRYVAICRPLRYTIIMQDRCVLWLLVCSWSFSFFVPIIPTWLLTHLDFCGPNHIEHYFCDTSPLVSLSCDENMVKELSVFVGFIPFSLIILSYVYIARSILRIRTTKGRQKAFYTCSSHLTVVCLLYLTIFCLYMRPTTSFTLDSDKLISLLYTTLTPMLNPIIYSLKNKDVKSALKRLMTQNKTLLV
uniref:Olfactory receptor n=1 Tax=Leptobrachium leishanense TaxID=445787 RepID=A0A8C5R116_9ANUR